MQEKPIGRFNFLKAISKPLKPMIKWFISLNKWLGQIIASHTIRFLVYSGLCLLIFWISIQVVRANAAMNQLIKYDQRTWQLPGDEYKLKIRYPSKLLYDSENLLIARLECVNTGKCNFPVSYDFAQEDLLLFSTDSTNEKNWHDTLNLSFSKEGEEITVYMRLLGYGPSSVSICLPNSSNECNPKLDLSVEGTLWPKARLFLNNLGDLALFISILLGMIGWIVEENKRHDDRLRETIRKQIDELHQLKESNRAIFLQALTGMLEESLKWPVNFDSLRKELYHFCNSTITSESILEILSELYSDNWSQGKALLQRVVKVMRNFSQQEEVSSFSNLEIFLRLSGLLGEDVYLSDPLPEVTFLPLDGIERTSAKIVRAALILANDQRYGQWAHRLCVAVILQACKESPGAVYDYLYIVLQNHARVILSDARFAGLRSELIRNPHIRVRWRFLQYFKFLVGREPTTSEITEITSGDKTRIYSTFNSALGNDSGNAWLDNIITLSKAPLTYTSDHQYPFWRGENGYPWTFTFYEWRDNHHTDNNSLILSWLQQRHKFDTDPFADYLSPFQDEGRLISTSFPIPSAWNEMRQGRSIHQPLLIIAPTNWDANALLQQFILNPVEEELIRNTTFLVVGSVQDSNCNHGSNPWNWIFSTLADQWLNYLLIRPLFFSCLLDEDQNSLAQLLYYAAGSLGRLEAWINYKQQQLLLWMRSNNSFAELNSGEAYETELLQFRKILRNRCIVADTQAWKVKGTPDNLTRQLWLNLRPSGFERTFLTVALPGSYPNTVNSSEWLLQLANVASTLAQNKVFLRIFASREISEAVIRIPTGHFLVFMLSWSCEQLVKKIRASLSAASNGRVSTMEQLFIGGRFRLDDWLADRGEGSLGITVNLGHELLSWFTQKKFDAYKITLRDLEEFEMERHGPTTE